MNSLKSSIVAYFPLIRWLRYPRRIFMSMHGYANSLRQGRPVDADGKALPWYTYPAIEQLAQYDFSNSRILEFGAGYSTMYWGRRAGSVVSIEHDPDWHEEIAKQVPENCVLRLCEERDEYVDIATHGNAFDVAIIDGVGEWRLSCTRQLCKMQDPPPMVILDNSDWFLKSSKLLRERGYFQTDFSGLGPINAYTWTTSLFLLRDSLPTQNNWQDPSPIGGAKTHWMHEE